MSKSLLTYVINALSLGLALLLGYFLLRIVMGLLQPQSLWQPAVIADMPSANISVNSQSYDFSTDPFSKGVVELDVPKNLGEDAPETTLNLTLTGLITGPDGQVNLKTPDGREARYAIGNEVMNNVTLEAVNPTFIVLKVNGELQRLTFDEEEIDLIRTEMPEPSSTPIKNTEALLSMINLTPALENGQMQGLRIMPKRSDVPLSDYGLQAGDIITAIGPVDLSQGQPDLAALRRSLQASGTIDIFVIRNGREEIIQLRQ